MKGKEGMKLINAFFIGLAGFLAWNSSLLAVFTHTFENGTQFPAELKVTYNVCKDEVINLEPGASQIVNAGLCSLKSVEATIKKSDKDTDIAAPFTRTLGYSGSSTWALMGPVDVTAKNPTGSIFRVWRLGLGNKEE